MCQFRLTAGGGKEVWLARLWRTEEEEEEADQEEQEAQKEEYNLRTAGSCYNIIST